MVKVAVLKDQAREFERRGQTDQALAIYRHILSHLEGTPAIGGQLPLYVKVGDLELKGGDSEAAVRMYERAAEGYAELGSSRSVIALCLKILRAAPTRTSVHLRFARELLDRGHVSAARDVLQDFAERADLAKPLDKLRRLADRSDEEIRPILEGMLAGVKRPESAPPVSDAAFAPPAEPPEPLPGPPESPAPSDEADEAVPSFRKPHGVPFPPEEAGREDPEDGGPAGIPLAAERPLTPPELRDAPVSPPEPSPEPGPEDLVEREAERDLPLREEPAGIGMGPAKRADGGPAVDDSPWLEPDADGATPAPRATRPPFQAFAVEANRRRRARLIWSGVGLAVVGAVVALVLSGLVPLDWARIPALLGNGGPGNAGGDVEGGPAGAILGDTGAGDTAAVAEDLPDTASAVAPGDTMDAFPPDTADTAETRAPPHENGAAGDGDTLVSPDTAVGDTAPAEPGSTPEGRESASGRVLAGTLANGPSSGPSPDLVPDGPVIVVEGLPVDSVSRFPSGDVVGIRVIHALEGGERLTLRAVPLQGGLADAGGGTPRVTTLRGDTAFGTVMFSGYFVNARGRLPAAEMEALLRRLVLVQP